MLLLERLFEGVEHAVLDCIGQEPYLALALFLVVLVAN